MKVDAEKLAETIRNIATAGDFDPPVNFVEALRECFVEEPVRIFCLYCSSQVKDVHRPGCEAPAEGTFKAPAKAEECECGHPEPDHEWRNTGVESARVCTAQGSAASAPVRWAGSCLCRRFRPRVPQGEGAEPCKTDGHEELHLLWTKAATGVNTYIKAQWVALDNAMSRVRCDLRDARAQIEATEKNLYEADKNIKKWRIEAGGWCAKLKAAEAQIEEKDKEIARLRAELFGVRQAHEYAHEDQVKSGRSAEIIRQNWAREKEQDRVVIVGLRAEVARLTKERDDYRADRDAWGRKAEVLTRERDEARAERDLSIGGLVGESLKDYIARADKGRADAHKTLDAYLSELTAARAEIQKLTEERDAQKNRADTYQAFAEARRPMDWQRLVTDRDEAIKGLSLALAEAQGERDAARNECDELKVRVKHGT